MDALSYIRVTLHTGILAKDKYARTHMHACTGAHTHSKLHVMLLRHTRRAVALTGSLGAVPPKSGAASFRRVDVETVRARWGVASKGGGPSASMARVVAGCLDHDGMQCNRKYVGREVALSLGQDGVCPREIIE